MFHGKQISGQRETAWSFGAADAVTSMWLGVKMLLYDSILRMALVSFVVRSEEKYRVTLFA